ncbi:PRTRC system protein C [Pseudomonas sp. V1]|uniref:PRTRC system protein C n=1 Tax=Pseudomonas arcuscaelestis TaxID=2710591 RepID=UPI00193F9CD4|nr:PRTRC system protein C [Pseudomonas arcuscaelestis]MBM3105665.1 PRTRC system protein C [Pseudomonas arcuscaelestis]
MSIAIVALDRVFRFGGRDLADPDPSMEPSEVMKHYSRQYPRLVGAKIVEPIAEGDTFVYEFREASFGDKG